MPRHPELPDLPGEVDHLVERSRGRELRLLRRGCGPVEEGQRLEEGDAVAEVAASLDDAAGDAGGDGAGGGDSGEVEGEGGDGEAGVRRRGEGGGEKAGAGVPAVVLPDQGVEVVGD